MSDRRQQLVEVFQDTQKFYAENKTLAAAVAYGRQNTKLYNPDDYPEFPVSDPKPGRIRVIAAKTFEAAMNLRKASRDKKIAVLNFASATTPGGGVKNGSSAQEESLCRCSTLYPTIDRRWLWEKYYGVNREARDNRHTDACIYSPGVIICKTDDTIPERLEEKDFVTVDVITCAAPNLRNIPSNWHNPETGKPIKMDSQELYALHVKRAKHILQVAAANEADILILGAFGCGAFQNDPDIVAKAYRKALEDYRNSFDSIVFAIYCSGRDKANFEAFEKVLGKQAESGIPGART